MKKILQPGQKIIYSRINGIEKLLCEFDSDYETELLKIRGGKELIEQIRYEHPFAIMLKKDSQKENFLNCFRKKRQPYLSITLPKERVGDAINASLFKRYERQENKIILIGGRVNNFAIEYVGIDLDRVLTEGYNRGINNQEIGSLLFPRSKSE